MERESGITDEWRGMSDSVKEAPVEEIILEDQLLDHLATPEGVEALIQLRFDPLWINEKEDDVRKVYDFVIGYVATHGNPPSKEVMSYEFPIEFLTPVCEVDWLVEQFRIRHIRNESMKVTKKVARLISSDPSSAVDAAISEFSRIQSESLDRSDELSENNWDEQIESYKKSVQEGFHTGVTFGWDEIDQTLGGLRKGGIYYVIARPKRGKSWMLLMSATQAYLKGENVAFFTLEMTQDEMYGRFQCIVSGVNYGRYVNGQLLHDEIQAMRKAKEQIDASTGTITFLRPSVSERTVQSITQIAKDHNATVCYVDQLKFLKASREVSPTTPRHQEIEWINEELKDAASEFPWYIACQYNREAAKMDEMADLTKIGLSDSIGQTADMLLGIYQSKGMRENKVFEFGVIDARSFETARWEMKNNIGVDTSFKLLGRCDV